MSDTVIVDANVLFSPSMQDALNDKLLNIGAAKIIIIFFFYYNLLPIYFFRPTTKWNLTINVGVPQPVYAI